MTTANATFPGLNLDGMGTLPPSQPRDLVDNLLRSGTRFLVASGPVPSECVLAIRKISGVTVHRFTCSEAATKERGRLSEIAAKCSKQESMDAIRFHVQSLIDTSQPLLIVEGLRYEDFWKAIRDFRENEEKLAIKNLSFRPKAKLFFRKLAHELKDLGEGLLFMSARLLWGRQKEVLLIFIAGLLVAWALLTQAGVSP